MTSRRTFVATLLPGILAACADVAPPAPLEGRADALSLAAPAGCFTAHVVEAIQLNRERTETYAAMSGGRSRAVSYSLIASEHLTLPVAGVFDARALLLQRAGVPIMCDEFVSMEEAPPLEGPVPASEPVPALVHDFDVRLLADAVKQGYADGGFPAVSALLEGALEELSAHPSYLCMTRHMVESALRASNLAPRHREAARKAKVSWLRPEAISWDFVRLQVDALPLGQGLDRMAAPLQAEGVPVLCSDLPPIPPH